MMPSQRATTEPTSSKTGFGFVDLIARLQTICLRQATGKPDDVNLAFFSQHALRDIGLDAPLNDNRSTSYGSTTRHRIMSSGITGL